MTFQDLQKKLTTLVGAVRAEEIVNECKKDGYEESDCPELWSDLQEEYRYSANTERYRRCGY